MVVKIKRKSPATKPVRGRRKLVALTLDDYRSLAENSPDVIDRFDREFRHLYTNPAGARMHKVGVDQIVGKTIRETGVPEPFSTLWEDRIRKVFESGQPLELRDTFQTAVGSGYYESRCVPEFAQDGSVRSVLVVTREVSATARIVGAKLESEVFLRKIIEYSPISMAIVGMDGRIEYINKKAIETFGYSPEDIPTMEQWWLRAYPDAAYRQEVIARWMGHVQEALAENVEIKGDEYWVTCKDGSLKTIYIFGVPVVDKVFVIFNDVTAYKTLHAELEKYRDELEGKVKDRTAKLQALAEEVIRVEHRERLRIAHVLHEDLQQWLAAAKFRVGELQDFEMPAFVKQTADRVQDMLVKAIEVTRTLAVGLRPPIIHEQGLKMALGWLARDMKNKFGLNVSVKVNRVSNRVSEELGIFVFDAVRELLLNASKHSGVKDVSVKLKPEGRGRFRVEVSDKGCGFDPSRIADNKFGLFSIRERADVLGGHMKMVSKPDQGACIAIILPYRQTVL